MWFDGQGEVVRWDGNPILLDQSIQQDADILKAMEPWKKEIDAVATRKIGSSRVLLKRDCRYEECNMGNFITDAMVDAFVDAADNKSHWTYAAVGCTNPGGIRAEIEVSDITYGDLIMVHPFQNTWDTLELTGETIKKILEIEGLLVWSGLRVTYKVADKTRTAVDVKIRCQSCEYPVYEDMVSDRWYRVVVPTFLVTGGDGYYPFKNNSRNHKVGMLDMDHLTKYVTKMSPITAGVERRSIFLEP